MKKISVVVPTCFSASFITEFYTRTCAVIDSLKENYESEIIFINDGSQDNTINVLKKISDLDRRVKVISFSRNFGNQNAITAGLEKATGDAAIIIDDDLQDPPEVIRDMIALWQQGYNSVYGVRKSQKGNSLFFNLVTEFFYYTINLISDVNIPRNTGDFRLIDRAIIDNLLKLKEQNRYLRGMIPWIGFKQIGILYARDNRYAGKSNFTISKYINLALDGLTSFSTKPIYFVLYFGALLAFIGICGFIGLATMKLFFNYQGNGLIELIACTALLLFGMQQLSIGFLGLYVGRLHIQSKNRPLYIIEQEYGFRETTL